MRISQVDRTTKKVEPFFHPVTHYTSPHDVLRDAKLSTDEKRVILSSWASDMHVVESQPALREVPGIPHRLRLSDILAALKQLDEEDDPPPRGGLAMRLPRFSRTDCISLDEPQHSIGRQATRKRYRLMQASRKHSNSRWTREANVRRYRRLLNTRLTDVERNYIERRLAEELRG
jgi:hypothetical protein